jgi:hypothetical protein
VDPRDGLADMDKLKFLTLLGLELQQSIVKPVASRYTNCATEADLRETVLKTTIEISMKLQNTRFDEHCALRPRSTDLI